MANKVTLEEMRNILGMEKGEKDKEVGKAKLDDDGNVIIMETTLKALGEKVTEYATNELTPAISKTIATVAGKEADTLSQNINQKLDKRLAELEEKANSVRVVEIKTPKSRKRVDGVRHHNFEKLLNIVNLGQPCLMVGPAGTGKTHSAQLVAETLGMDFYSISVGSQTSKSDLQGYMTATGTYVRTQFREAYEKGGVFLLDEADAGNSNVLILLNAALSNGYMAFPDGMVKAHDDFRMIATANTFGNGATRQYVGRNQLDAATLDRFTVLTWNIDDKVEENMAGSDETGRKWLAAVRAVRKKAIDELELRVVVSPRATLRGAQLLAAGIPFDDVLELALIGNMKADDKVSLKNLAEAAWNKN